MKVVHVEAGRHLYGGAQQVLYLLEGLRAHDVENVLVCPAGSAISAVCPDGVRLQTLPMAGDVDVPLIGRLRRLLRKERPDIVHLHSRRGADTFGALAAWRCGAKVILTRRVDNPESALALRLKYPLYDHVITISAAIGKVLHGQGVPRERMTCVPDAVDARRWQSPQSRAALAREFSLEPAARAVGMIAQFIPRKGHETLLDALPAVVEHYPDLQVLLFGKGPRQQAIQRAAADRGLAHNVLFAGFRNDLPRWLGALDLLVHPAHREGLGVALLQAASAGVPIVASDAGGIGEVVIDGQTGILVPPGRPAALATGMLELLAEPGRAATLAAGARAHVERVFSVAAMTDGTLAVYRRALGMRVGLDAADPPEGATHDAAVPEEQA